MEKAPRHIVSVLVQNQPGVLVRVASMFSRREFNIDSLAVGVTQSPEYSRMTVVIHGDQAIVTQMMKQLEKLLEVVAVQLLESENSVHRGMTLLKVKAEENMRLEILKIAEIFRAKVVDVQQTTVILEITGDDEKIDAFTRLLSPYGILETIRTGLIGLERGDQTIYRQRQEEDYYG